MIEVTDMIVDVGKLTVPIDLPDLALREVEGRDRDEILRFVMTEHPRFARYFEAPKPESAVCSIRRGDEVVGAVLLEQAPDAAELPTDAALACLVIRHSLRGQRLGSSAIVACCQELASRGFHRVIAEWVASVEMYGRLGFEVWKTRTIDPDAT